MMEIFHPEVAANLKEQPAGKQLYKKVYTRMLNFCKLLYWKTKIAVALGQLD